MNTAWVRAVTVLGATTVIALYLVYWITTDFDQRLGRLELKMDTVETHRSQETQQVNAFLYAICLNSAGANEIGLARCAVALDGGLTQR